MLVRIEVLAPSFSAWKANVLLHLLYPLGTRGRIRTYGSLVNSKVHYPCATLVGPASRSRTYGVLTQQVYSLLPPSTGLSQDGLHLAGGNLKLELMLD